MISEISYVIQWSLKIILGIHIMDLLSIRADSDDTSPS